MVNKVINKKGLCGGNLLFLAVLFAVTLVLGVLQKPLFLLRHAAAGGGVTAAEVWSIMWHGALLDATVAGYATALPLLAAIVCCWVPAGRAARMIVKGWLTFVAAASAVTFAGNMALYGYWGFPLDASVLQFLATPREAAASASAGEIAACAVVTVVWFAVTEFCYMRTARLWSAERPAGGVRAVLTAVLTLVGGLDFLAIRGGVTESVANLSKVCFSERAFLNHAAVNPLFSFLSSAAASERLDEYEFFDDERRAEIFEKLTVSASEEGRREWLRTQRPDIVLILAESFGLSTVDEVAEGRPVAPEFQRLKGEGLYFANMTANSFRTDRGTVAVLSGFPAQPRMSIMKKVSRAVKLPSIARSLRAAGYETSFVYGGDINFTNTASYLYGTGFSRLLWQRDMSFDVRAGAWGYADDVTADFFCDHVEELQRSGQRFFTVWQTLSSHEPFDVPCDRFEDRVLNSMSFADECIGRVVERLKSSPRWDDMLVVIIADHAFRYPYDVAASAWERHRIPMLWLGGALDGAGVIDDFASQSDLAATLLAQLGIAHDDFVFSRDIADPSLPKFGYWCFNDGFGVVDESGRTIWDHGSGAVVSTSAESARQADWGRAVLQTTFKEISSL